MSTKPNSPPSERSAETRQRILDAAAREFAAKGLAGARMEAIAAAAGVNKALLYYYFDSKEKLYLAALEMISEKVRDRAMAVFLKEVSPGEKLLRAALEHFDRILTQHEFQALMQQEMIRLHKGQGGALPILYKRVFAPAMTMYQAMIREGTETGELIEADWMQMQLAVLGGNVMYFLSAPVMRLLLPTEPFAPEVLAERRKAIVRYLGQAIFVDREHGRELAERVLADSPMPAVDTDRFLRWGNDEREE